LLWLDKKRLNDQTAKAPNSGPMDRRIFKRGLSFTYILSLKNGEKTAEQINATQLTTSFKSIISALNQTAAFHKCLATLSFLFLYFDKKINLAVSV